MAAEASSEAASNVQSGLALSAATRLTSPSISLAMASLLTRRRLGVRVVGIGLVGFVMANDATGRCAELAVSRHVAGGAADDGALDAAFRLHARGRSDCDRGREDRCEHAFHDCSPKLETAESIRSGGSRSGLLRGKGAGLGLPSYDATPATMARRIANRPCGPTPDEVPGGPGYPSPLRRVLRSLPVSFPKPRAAPDEHRGARRWKLALHRQPPPRIDDPAPDEPFAGEYWQARLRGPAPATSGIRPRAQAAREDQTRTARGRVPGDAPAA